MKHDHFTDERIDDIRSGRTPLTESERVFLLEDTPRFEECGYAEAELAVMGDDALMSEAPAEASALDVQVGGGHYKDMKIQPVEYIRANGIGYIEGCVIKYVSRWRKKNGVEDLQKARHFIDLLLELENAK